MAATLPALAALDFEDLARFIELIPAPVTVLDRDGMSLLVNRAYCEALDLAPEVIMSRTVDEAMHPADVSVAEGLIEAAIAHGVGRGDLRMGHRDGKHRTFHWDLLFNEGIDRIIGIAIDRTSERRRLAEAQERAMTDELTGLLSRAGLMEVLADVHGEHPDGGVVVALFDIDGFKTINDTNGHQVGDHVLQTVGERIRENLGDLGGVGRLGGDEFVAVVPEPGGDAAGVIDAVQRSFADPCEFDGRRVPIRVSIGWCRSHGHESVDELLRNADIAVYEAKRSGGGRACAATDELVAAWERARTTERSLQIALRDGDLHPYFQPIVDLESGRVVAHEVLLRWIGAEGAVRPAAEFIEVAEGAGMLPAMSADVRRAAIAVAGGRAGLRLTLNVSADELLAEGYVSDLVDTARAHRVEPERIVIEITEQTALRDLDRAAVVLAELRSAGFTVALDDFGSGYSSLTYLTRLPIDVVKLDGQFVAAAAVGGRGLELLHAVVGFLTRLDMTTVIEGVETEAEHRLVSTLGIDCGQGWFYGHPGPASDLPD